MKKIIISFLALAAVSFLFSCNESSEQQKVDVTAENTISTGTSVIKNLVAEHYNPNLDSLFLLAKTSEEKTSVWLQVKDEAQRDWLNTKEKWQKRWLDIKDSLQENWLKVKDEAFALFKEEDPVVYIRYTEVERENNYRKLDSLMIALNSPAFKKYQATQLKAWQEYRDLQLEAWKEYEAVQLKAWQNYQDVQLEAWKMSKK